jgi:UDP-glucuronate 4-epimerase
VKILITGTAGFIGFHLSKKMVECGFEVYGIDNLNDYYDVNYKLLRLSELGIKLENKQESEIKSSIYSNFSFSKIDIRDNISLNEFFKKHKPELVVHLAAQAGVRYSLSNPDEYLTNNIVGFYNIINATRLNNVDTFFYASSSSVYGDSSVLPFSEIENVDKPVSLYAASKKTNELIAHTFSNLYNLKTVGLRFFTVYGPYGRPDMAYFDFTKSILNGTEIKVFNNGNLSRDFTYIDDIVKGIMLLLNTYNVKSKNNISNYEIFNIGNSQPIKLLDFIKTIEECLGVNAILNFVDMQKGDVHNTYSDSSKLYSITNFKPQTKLIDGVFEFVSWYKNHHNSEGIVNK